MLRYHTAIASVSLLALALGGCHKSSQDMSTTTPDNGLPALPAALPMQNGPASQPTIAPPVSAIPAGRYVSVSRPVNDREAYAYLDRASDIEDEIGDAPPDYDYDNRDGVAPWVWKTNGGDYRYAEPTANGYRYYYYRTGAEYPYLVRAHDYSYAYAGGALVAMYGANGALVPPDRYGSYRDQASRYFSRGQQLRQAAGQRPHQGVVAADWAAQRPQFSAAQANWAAARTQQPAWQAYHARNDPSHQPGWQQELQQRAAVAQQFSGWQSHGFAGAPPPVLAAVGAHATVAPAAPQGFARPNQPQPRDFAAPQGRAPLAGPPPGPVANIADQAAMAHERQLAAQRQALASQRLAQEASQAQHDAAAQRQAAAARQQQLAAQNEAQQQVANVHRQQDMAAQQQVAARQQVLQHEALLAARQAQLHALAAQRQADVARMQASRITPPAPPAARVPVPAQHPPELRPPAPNAGPSRPGQSHAPPGRQPDHGQDHGPDHGKDSHQP
ncbi:MAG: hypothetical protein M3N34_05935 [Pseudomonadota bacterium]|nr:hypothetical protein [Pseudomonadota bacterium]